MDPLESFQFLVKKLHNIIIYYYISNPFPSKKKVLATCLNISVFFNVKCFINVYIFFRFRMAIRYIRHLQAILEFGPEYETKLYAVPCTQYLPPPTYYGYQPPYGQCWTAGDYAPNMSNPY